MTPSEARKVQFEMVAARLKRLVGERAFVMKRKAEDIYSAAGRVLESG
jgi:hypothetical protein